MFFKGGSVEISTFSAKQETNPHYETLLAQTEATYGPEQTRTPCQRPSPNLPEPGFARRQSRRNPKAFVCLPAPRRRHCDAVQRPRFPNEYPHGSGGQFDEGTFEPTILNATGIYRAFAGGHNHMVDRLHSLANGSFDEFCFCKISQYQFP
jgi:hypothetical protein